MKKYRSERKGRRSFDTAIEYGTVAMVAREKTRTGRAAFRATRCGGLAGAGGKFQVVVAQRAQARDFGHAVRLQWEVGSHVEID
ncbi:MAG: hypothetical protein ABSF46_27075, partial [Terriglobia bacterium]